MNNESNYLKKLKFANYNLMYILFYKNNPPLKVELILGVIQILQFNAFSFSLLVRIKIKIKLIVSKILG